MFVTPIPKVNLAYTKSGIESILLQISFRYTTSASIYIDARPQNERTMLELESGIPAESLTWFAHAGRTCDMIWGILSGGSSSSSVGTKDSL